VLVVQVLLLMPSYPLLRFLHVLLPLHLLLLVLADHPLVLVVQVLLLLPDFLALLRPILVLDP
jgi:hypothetical protein